jgi:SAM-dependent methyltransferase
MIRVVKATSDLLLDGWFGVQTFDDRVPQVTSPTGDLIAKPHWSMSQSYIQIYFLLSAFEVNENDIFYDIGCGRGRVVCLMARRKIKKSIGIERDGAVAQHAKENAHRLRKRRCEIKIQHAEATEADYTGGTIYWMANPFDLKTLEIVLDRIKRTLIDNPRHMRIGYSNPVFREAVTGKTWLKFVGDRRLPGAEMYASYWEHTP